MYHGLAQEARIAFLNVSTRESKEDARCARAWVPLSVVLLGIQVIIRASDRNKHYSCDIVCYTVTRTFLVVNGEMRIQRPNAGHSSVAPLEYRL